jgi:hypothetical protein
MLAVVAGAAFASAAHATIDFDVTGLAGTGVTAHVTFTYTHTSATDATLKFVIENTTDYSDPDLTGSRISAFAFNVPSTISISTIGGFANLGGVFHLGNIPPNPTQSFVDPEGSPVANEDGWYGLWESNGIKTTNSAGDFDVGILNDNNATKFITDGVGSGPRIENISDSSDSTTFTLNVVGTGLDTAGIEAAIMSELSAPQQVGGIGYSFAVRFQGIGPNDDSDLATTIIPAPGAAALAAFGLGIVGWVHRRRAR